MKELNLCLHCGAGVATAEEVELIAPPKPTKTWHPIAHSRLISTVEKSLVSNNFAINQSVHSMTHDGNRYFGLMEIVPRDMPTDESQDYSWVVGLRNSSDKSFPAGMVVGSAVFVCDNLAFSGEIQFGRKHTSRIIHDLPSLVDNAVIMLRDRYHGQAERFDRYKHFDLTEAGVHDLLIRSVDDAVIPNREIPHVLREWRTPSIPGSFPELTAWRLFNAFTTAMKDTSLQELPARTIALHALMDKRVGYIPKHLN